MTYTRNIVILALAIGLVTLGYFYYESRQNVIEINLPRVTVDGK
jgi:hypothetical protein